MATQYKSRSYLTDGLVWVLLRYSDNSEFCFQTTLNPGILNRLGVVLEEGKLVRLDKQYYERGDMVYRQFAYEGASVSLWDEEHYIDPLSARLKDFM